MGLVQLLKLLTVAGSYLVDERTDLEYNYTKRSVEIYCEIFAPELSPKWVNYRSKLWNQVERIEKRKDAQLAREINIALPNELFKDEQKELVREYIKDNFVIKGMIADVAFHYNENNPHIHIMLTMRDITLNGFQKKNRSWNDKKNMEIWALKTNGYLAKAKINERIDHRSYEKQGKNQLPQMHLGVKYYHMERKGITTKIGDLNREVKAFNNKQLVELEEYKKLKEGLVEANKKYIPKKNYSNR